MTSVGWIDFSSEHRDKVRTVLDLLRQRGVVDELACPNCSGSRKRRQLPAGYRRPCRNRCWR